MSTLAKLGIRTGPSLTEKIFYRVNHPMHPTILFVPISALLVWLAWRTGEYSWSSATLYFILGLLSWTGAEYFNHRVWFHYNTTKEPWRTLTSALHMAHHRDTEDKYLIFPPLTVSLLISSLIYLVFFLVTQSFSAGALLMAGLGLGYVFYEWMHYAAHQYRSQLYVWKYLRKYHLAHHFKSPKYWYGVTVPFWDMLFGTYKPLGEMNSKDKSEKAEAKVGSMAS